MRTYSQILSFLTPEMNFNDIQQLHCQATLGKFFTTFMNTFAEPSGLFIYHFK